MFRHTLEVITETEFEEGILIVKDYYAPYVGKVFSQMSKAPNSKEFFDYFELIEYR